jgi:EAL domain-containing protein (putative c-di-GMP-specific phosphodiesterase class I)/CHASE2 domain-containing sensor protein
VPDAIRTLLLRWRGIGLCLLLGAFIGMAQIAVPLDRMIEAASGRMAWRPVSGDIVVVALDDQTLRQFGKNDFSMTQHARVIDAVNQARAKRLFVDFLYDQREANADFSLLTAAVRRMDDRIVLGAVPASEYTEAILPNPAFGKAARPGNISVDYEFWQVWRMPMAGMVEGQLVPSFSALLADRQRYPLTTYVLDYTYRTDSIPTYSVIDLLSGKVGARELAGKNVIFAPTALSYQDTHFLPGHSRVPGAFLHVIGAETLKRGNPSDIGWLPAFALTAVMALGIATFRGARRYNILSVALVLALIGTKMALAAMLVTSSIGAALFTIGAVGVSVSRRRRRESAQRENPVSGLPNFEALQSQSPFGSHSVIAARVVNFDDLTAFLPGDGSKQLVEQVTRRLQLASQSMTLHHDPHGSFAWLVPYYQHSQIEEQLAGLAALFNAPLTIGERRIDVSIAFGVNDEFEGSNAQRLAAALLAAEQAIRTRVLWTKYVPREQEDAGWALSFHSQLEDAMTNGDIWVAFQPQHDIATQALAGFEALARWTHPTRGPIPPDQFIVQAEKSQDIYRLTLFVMDKAIHAAAQLRASGIDAGMSVNLSAALLDHDDLVRTIRVMLGAHQLPADRLTIEITETAQIEDSARARQMLAQIRRAGIRLSIDDYGTGQSNLEYLTEIEADEIKIDKRFVMTMRDSPRNLEVVKSTIELAHRLGAVAVAEGIEDAATMTLLGQLGCDVGQGYHLGKPQTFSEIVATFAPAPHSRTA